MKLKTILAMASISAGLGYLYLASQDDDATNIEGLNIDVKPDVLIDSAVGLSRIPSQYKNGVANASKRLVSGFLAGRGI